MDLVHLVKLVRAGKEWRECQHFVENATDAPVIHLMIIVAVGQKALWRPVPARTDVLCERWLGVDSTAAAEIGQLDDVSSDQNVLGLDVPMIDAVTVHVVD